MADEQLATGWGAREPIDDNVVRQFLFNQADALRATVSGPAARLARPRPLGARPPTRRPPDVRGARAGTRGRLATRGRRGARRHHLDDVRVLERIAIDGFPIERARRGVSRRGPRRGVWSALVWSRVAEAPDLPAVAFTSNDSRPGFVKLGFLPVTRLTFLVRPPVPA